MYVHVKALLFLLTFCNTARLNYIICNILYIDVDQYSIHKQSNESREIILLIIVLLSHTVNVRSGQEDDHLTTVKQFEYTAWKEGLPAPDDTTSFLDMTEAVLKWQPHLTESQPVLVHCRYIISVVPLLFYINMLQRKCLIYQILSI
jgi:hypothetical protein